MRFRHPAGGWHHFSVEMFRSEASENHYNDAAVFGVMIDITERKQAEERLLHHSRLADLGVMATGIAHELNQPLDIIKLMATNMEDLVAENEADSDYLLTKLRSIVAQVERAARITNHMRLFGRPENVPAAPVLLNDLLFEMVELLHSQTSLRNIELKLDLPEEPLSVLGRANLIEQVFLNLVINAMRQIDDGEPPGDSGAGLRQISLRMQSEQEGRWVSVKCADRAGGIDPVVLGRIFDPFVTTRGPGMGTGLGLSVAFDIIDEMGGEISAENRDGGAVFTVLLPLVDRVSTEPALVGA